MGTVKCSETLSSNHAQIYVTFNCFKLPLFMPSYGVDHLFSKCIFPASMYLVFNLLYNFVQRNYTLYNKTFSIIHKFRLPEFILGITYVDIISELLYFMSTVHDKVVFELLNICTCVVNCVCSWNSVSVVISFTFI